MHVSMVCNTCLLQIQPNDNQAPNFREHNCLSKGRKDRRNDAALQNMLPRSVVKAYLLEVSQRFSTGLSRKFFSQVPQYTRWRRNVAALWFAFTRTA